MDDHRVLTFAVIEYGMSHEEFTLDELYSSLSATQNDRNFIELHLVKQRGNPDTPNNILGQSQWKDDKGEPLHGSKILYRLLPNAIFQYADYIEIKEAKRIAFESKKLAWIAIAISMLVGLAELFIGGVIGVIQIIIELIKS